MNPINVADNYYMALSQKQQLIDQRKRLNDSIKNLMVKIDEMENALLLYMNENPQPIPLQDGKYLTINTKTTRKTKNKQEKQEALESVLREIQTKNISPDRSILKINNALSSNPIIKPYLAIKTAKELLVRPVKEEPAKPNDIRIKKAVTKKKVEDDEEDDDVALSTPSPETPIRLHKPVYHKEELNTEYETDKEDNGEDREETPWKDDDSD